MILGVRRCGRVLAAAICAALLTSCGEKLVDETTVPLPIDGAKMVVSYRVEGFDTRFEVEVRNASGSLRHPLWYDWGPAKRGNVYVTPDERIVVIGGGGTAYMFEVKAGQAPRVIPDSERPRETGEDWIFLGDFYLREGGVLNFFSGGPEIIPLYGAGSSPYRIRYQSLNGE